MDSLDDPMDHLICNHFSWTRFLEPDFSNQISKNCKNWGRWIVSILTLLPILDQNHKVIRIALGNKTKLFGISYKLLPKNSTYLQENPFLFCFQGQLLCTREITEPLRKIKIWTNDLRENVSMTAWLLGLMVIYNLVIFLVP